VLTKRVGLLRELVPTAVQVAVLINPANPANTSATLTGVEAVAAGAGAVVLTEREVSSSSRREVSETETQELERQRRESIWIGCPPTVESDTTLNTGALRTKGVDVNANYRFDFERLGMENMGGLTINFVGTYLKDLKIQSLPGDAYFDCAGLYGTICSVSGGLSSPNPKWRHKMRMTWATPFEAGDWFKAFSLSMQWRHYDKVKLDAYDADPQLNNTGLQYATDRTLSSRDYFDLSANWTMKENVKIRAGVNNIFDINPPLNGSSACPAGPCNGNTWPQVYDALGRFLFIGATVDF